MWFICLINWSCKAVICLALISAPKSGRVRWSVPRGHQSTLSAIGVWWLLSKCVDICQLLGSFIIIHWLMEYFFCIWQSLVQFGKVCCTLLKFIGLWCVFSPKSMSINTFSTVWYITSSVSIGVWCNELKEDEYYAVAVHLHVQEIGTLKRGECLLRNLAA